MYIYQIKTCKNFDSFAEKSVCGYQIVLGSSIKNLVLHHLIKPDSIQTLKKCFVKSKYMLIPDIQSKTLLVLLKPDASAPDIMKAYFHAMSFGICVSITCNIKSVSSAHLFVQNVTEINKNAKIDGRSVQKGD